MLISITYIYIIQLALVVAFLPFNSLVMNMIVCLIILELRCRGSESPGRCVGACHLQVKDFILFPASTWTSATAGGGASKKSAQDDQN